MNKTKLSWTMSNIEKMHDEKKVLSFSHPIQRKSEQWNNQQKSLLIHSMLANYPVPNIYVLREDSQEVDAKNKPIFNYFVMDGKQRLTSVLSFMWGEFPLDDNIPNIFIEDESSDSYKEQTDRQKQSYDWNKDRQIRDIITALSKFAGLEISLWCLP